MVKESIRFIFTKAINIDLIKIINVKDDYKNQILLLSLFVVLAEILFKNSSPTFTYGFIFCFGKCAAKYYYRNC